MFQRVAKNRDDARFAEPVPLSIVPERMDGELDVTQDLSERGIEIIIDPEERLVDGRENKPAEVCNEFRFRGCADVEAREIGSYANQASPFVPLEELRDVIERQIGKVGPDLAVESAAHRFCADGGEREGMADVDQSVEVNWIRMIGERAGEGAFQSRNEFGMGRHMGDRTVPGCCGTRVNGDFPRKLRNGLE